MSSSGSHLYAVIPRAGLPALLSGEKELRDLVSEDQRDGDGCLLDDTKSAGFARDQILLRITLPASLDLASRRAPILDVPGSVYLLPREVLADAEFEAVSEAEVMDVARKQLDFPQLPSCEPLVDAIRRTPPENREEFYGPRLVRAFEEREAGRGG